MLKQKTVTGGGAPAVDAKSKGNKGASDAAKKGAAALVALDAAMKEAERRRAEERKREAQKPARGCGCGW